MSAAEVTALLVYPVKSCRGISVEAAVVTSTGFLFDRTWVVVGPGGRFITQRQKPRLALVEVAIDPPELLQGAELGAHPDAALVLSAPALPELRVPLAISAERKLVPASVWEWAGLAVDEGGAAAAWFTQHLGTEARLVRYAGTPGPSGDPAADPLRRTVEPYWAAGQEIKFSDQFPFLLANESSLAELNAALPAPIPMDRFRPNIILRGAPAYAEDAWGRVSIDPPAGDGPSGGGGGGGITFDLVKPCSRCTVPNVDQATAERGDEPLETLQRLRSGRVLGWNDPPMFKNSVFFGYNMTVDGAGGLARVSDSIHVLSPQTRTFAAA